MYLDTDFTGDSIFKTDKYNVKQMKNNVTSYNYSKTVIYGKKKHMFNII